MQSCGGISGHFDAVSNCAKHTLNTNRFKCCLLTPFWQNLGWNWSRGQHLCRSVLPLALLLHCVFFGARFYSTMEWCDRFSTTILLKNTRLAPIAPIHGLLNHFTWWCLQLTQQRSVIRQLLTVGFLWLPQYERFMVLVHCSFPSTETPSRTYSL